MNCPERDLRAQVVHEHPGRYAVMRKLRKAAPQKVDMTLWFLFALFADDNWAAAPMLSRRGLAGFAEGSILSCMTLTLTIGLIAHI